MDASQWPQHQGGGLTRTMEEIQTLNNNNSNIVIMGTNTNSNSRASPSPMVEKRARPQKEQNLNCPRCNSTNTKFCYYNNYSLTQPRYFCKTCRRYWTQGGSLRNVPVGGGSRKNKRPSSSSSSTLASSLSSPSSNNIPSSKLLPDLNPPNTLPQLITSPQNPSTNKFLDAQDLNLAFPMQGIFNPNTNNVNMNGNISNSTPPPSTTTTAPISALDLLRSGIASRGSLYSYIPMPIPDPNSPLYPSGLPNLQEFKPNIMGAFPSSHHGGDNGNGNNENSMMGDNGARLLFPFADMNKLATSAKTDHHNHQIDDQSKGGVDHHPHHHQGVSGYWSGMLGGGAW